MRSSTPLRPARLILSGLSLKIPPVHLFLLKGHGCLMRMMAAYTFQPRIVLIGVDAFDFRPFACGIGKIGVTAETLFAPAVYGEFRRYCRMLQGCPVTVFTLNNFVGRGTDLLLLLGVALPAVFPSLIFCFKCLPLFYISLSVPAVQIPSLMDAEVLGYKEGSGNENNHRQRQHNKQGRSTCMDSETS